MNRNDFHRFFDRSGPVVLPVIHVLDTARTRENIRIATGEGANGVFLINHDFGIDDFLPIIRDAREAYPDLWMGLNFLAVTGADAFPRLGELQSEGCRIDAYWADDARIDEADPAQPEATAIDTIRQSSGWNGLYFGGTAFKKQRPVDPARYEDSARMATAHMDVVCTSGIATGEAADTGKIAAFRRGAGDTPIALASGITPENAGDYANIDAFVVATGINIPGDFYTIDPARLHRLMHVCEGMQR
jgi:hypothetical protein